MDQPLKPDPLDVIVAPLVSQSGQSAFQAADFLVAVLAGLFRGRQPHLRFLQRLSGSGHRGLGFFPASPQPGFLFLAGHQFPGHPADFLIELLQLPPPADEAAAALAG